MIILYVDKTKLTVQAREPITSGSIGVNQVLFKFSSDWTDMVRTACFRSGGQTISVLLDKSCICEVPWEVTDLDDAGKHLMIGLYGVRDGNTVLPTIWADAGIIQQGVQCGTSTQPPTAGIYEQILAALNQTLGKLENVSQIEIASDEAVDKILDEVFGPLEV